MKKILISQHYARNKGNVSLLYILHEAILEKIPDAEIIVGSFDPAATQEVLGFKSCEWPFITRKIIEAPRWMLPFTGARELFYILLNIIVAFMLRWKIISATRLSGRLEPLRIIYESDITVSPGGHLFTSFNPFPGVCAHFFPCFLAHIMKRPYMVMAQTIGPFYGLWAKPGILLTRYLVKHAAYISVRDEYSLENLRAYKCNVDKVKKTNEIVFLYPHSNENAKDIKNDPPVFGMTFHHRYFKRWMNYDEYLERCRQFIEMVMKEYPFKLKFISMEQLEGDRGDLDLLRSLRDMLSSPERVEIVKADMTPRNVLGKFEGLDYLYATKTHSVVYGLRLGIPTLGIAYDRKTTDFMRDFGQEQYSVTMEEFTPEKAFPVFRKLVENGETIKQQLADALTKIQAQAGENIDALNELTSK